MDTHLDALQGNSRFLSGFAFFKHKFWIEQFRIRFLRWLVSLADNEYFR